MPPQIQTLWDDRDKAEAVLEDVLKFMRKFRIGLFAREVGNAMRIALSIPVGTTAPYRRGFPHKRGFVREWRDFENIEALIGDVPALTAATDKTMQILESISKALRYYHSALIPYKIDGEPMMLLCEALPDQRWRCYAVVWQLDCYGYTDRQVKPQRTQ